MLLACRGFGILKGRRLRAPRARGEAAMGRNPKKARLADDVLDDILESHMFAAVRRHGRMFELGAYTKKTEAQAPCVASMAKARRLLSATSEMI